MSIPNKAAERIRSELKRFQPIVQAAKARDVNESDTVVIVTDLLQYIFGYDKYNEITSEHMIRGTFCDLAVKVGGTLAFLLEVKSIGTELKDGHVKQAVDYAANQGVEWVGLTNGQIWRIYKVTFSKPIESEVVVDLDLLSISHRDIEAIEHLGMLAKEGWQRARLSEHHAHRQALSRYTLAAVILSEPVLGVMRRQLRRISADIKISEDDLKKSLEADVLKREVLEGDKAAAAARQVSRAENRALRKAKEQEAEAETPISASPAAVQEASG
jgi:predicted type IV restriction endonuclease